MPPSFDFQRFLNIRGANGPTFLPAGPMAFITNITGLPQVWTVAAPGAWPVQVTFGAERVLYAHAAHADGRMILGSDSGGNEHVQLALLSADGATQMPLDPNLAVIHTFGGWAPDDSAIAYAANTRHPAFFDIYTLALDAPDATPHLVYQQDGSNGVAAWAPDGQALIVEHLEKPSNHDLYLVPLDGSPPRHLTPHTGDAVYHHVEWAPDGRHLYLITDEGREFEALVRFDLETGAREPLVTPDWDIDFCFLSPDGTLLAYSINVDGYSELHVRDLGTGADRQPAGLPHGNVGYTGSSASAYAPELAWAPDSRRLAFNVTAPARNLEIWQWNLDGDAVAQVTRNGMAGIPADTFVEPELLRYPTFDGREVPAFFYRPHKAADGPLPCIVQVHGGPEGQARVAFDPVIQYFVHRGYAVLAPNVRGSMGYGREYTHLDDVRKRMDSVHDLAAAVEWLRGSGQVAPDRIAVMGGSYGGFMTLAAVTTYPDLWAAGVDIVGIANFVTFLENTGPWRRKLREAEYGSLEADADFLRAISPIHHVEKITAPLMVVHGANDPRVPVSEAEQIVEILRSRQHPVEYLRFPDEGHGVVRLHNRLVAYPAIADFLDQHLGS